MWKGWGERVQNVPKFKAYFIHLVFIYIIKKAKNLTSNIDDFSNLSENENQITMNSKY